MKTTEHAYTKMILWLILHLLKKKTLKMKHRTKHTGKIKHLEEKWGKNFIVTLALASSTISK